MDGTICTPQDWVRVEDGHAHCLTRGETVGFTLLVVCAAVSGVAVLWVYILIIRNVMRNPGIRLIRQPMDIFMLSLLTGDLIHSLGTLMNIRWIGTGKSETGTFCAVQGVIHQAGPTSVALNIIVISIVTFMVWCGRRVRSRPMAYAVVAALWLLIIAFIAIPYGIHAKSADPYWMPLPLWCTIGKSYRLEHIITKYLWMWIALAIGIILYTPMVIWALGYIDTNPHAWWKFSVPDERERRSGQRLLAFAMASYPFSNMVLIIPLSFVRWLEYTGHHINSTTTIAVAIIFAFSGLVNVLLLLHFRTNLLLFRRVSEEGDEIVELEPAQDA